MNFAIGVLLLSLVCLSQATTDAALRLQIYARQRAIDTQLNIAQNLLRAKTQYAELTASRMQAEIERSYERLNNSLSYVNKLNSKVDEINQRGQRNNVDVSQCVAPLNEMRQRAEQTRADGVKCLDQQKTAGQTMADNVKTISGPMNEELEKNRKDAEKCNQTPNDLIQTLTCYSTALAQIQVLTTNKVPMVRRQLLGLITDMTFFPRRMFNTCFPGRVLATPSIQMFNTMRLADKCVKTAPAAASSTTAAPTTSTGSSTTVSGATSSTTVAPTTSSAPTTTTTRPTGGAAYSAEPTTPAVEEATTLAADKVEATTPVAEAPVEEAAAPAAAAAPETAEESAAPAAPATAEESAAPAAPAAPETAEESAAPAAPATAEESAAPATAEESAAAPAAAETPAESA